MHVNQKAFYKMEQQFSLIAGIEDIVVLEQNEQTMQFQINDHPPLDKCKLEYICCNRLWSKNYNPVYECRITGNKIKSISDFCILLKYIGKEAKFTTADRGNAFATSLCEQLNENNLLLSKLSGIDIYAISVEKMEGESFLRLSLSPYSGMITRIMMPPITSYIRPDSREIAALLQVMQLMLATVLSIIA